MEHGGNIWVTDARRRPGLAEKTKPCRFVAEIAFTDDFQSHWAVQIDVERLVSHPHRTATQLEQFPVFTRHQLVVLKSFRCLVRCRLDRMLGSRSLAGLNSASETNAEHADRTRFHRFRKLVAAARAGASVLGSH